MSKADQHHSFRCTDPDEDNPIQPEPGFAICRIVVKVPVDGVETFIENWEDVSKELEYSVGYVSPEVVSAVLTVPPGTKVVTPTLQIIEGKPCSGLAGSWSET